MSRTYRKAPLSNPERQPWDNDSKTLRDGEAYKFSHWCEDRNGACPWCSDTRTHAQRRQEPLPEPPEDEL